VQSTTKPRIQIIQSFGLPPSGASEVSCYIQSTRYLFFWSSTFLTTVVLFYSMKVWLIFFISLKLSLKYLNVSMYNCVQLNSSFFPGLLLRKLLSILLITYPRMPCMIFSRCPYSLVPLIYLELVPFFLLQGLYLITFDIYMFEILKGTYMTYIRDF
jgi:hypothetical protein